MFRAHLAAAVLALSGSAVLAAEPDIPFQKYQLPNGLTVILSEDHRTPQVAVNLWYHVGAANQTPGKSGFAHLFEHMMFSGTEHIQSPLTFLESLGVAPGSMANGTTNYDRTNYFEVVPANQLPAALWFESDRMGFLLQALTPTKLARQRDVVSNERRQTYENQPYGTAQLALCDTLYPKPHPYYDCVIGTISEIQSASLEEIKDFFRHYYAPNNASLAVVGDFDPASARQLIAKYFGPIPAGPEVHRPSVEQPKLPREIRLTIQDRAAELPRLTLVWNGVKPFSHDEAAGDVLAAILGSGKTSRLYKTLVFDKQVAVDVDAEDDSLGLGGYFQVDVVAREGHSVQELSPLVQQILDEVKQHGVTAREVVRAQRNITAQFLRGIERIGGFGGKADVLNSYEMWTGDPGYLKKDLARYRAVTPRDVQAFAQKYLPDDHRLVLDVEPQTHTASATP